MWRTPTRVLHLRREASRDPRLRAGRLVEAVSSRPRTKMNAPLMRAGLVEDGGWSAIVSHAAWRPLQIHAGARCISAAGIGLVTTAAGWRGRGLAAQVVGACLKAAAGEGAELALLFGTPSPLYERAGFVLAGRERVLRVEPGTDAEKPAIRCGRLQDAARLLPLLEEHALRVSRGVEEFQIQLGIANTELYVLEQDERLAALLRAGEGSGSRRSDPRVGRLPTGAGVPDPRRGLAAWRAALGDRARSAGPATRGSGRARCPRHVPDSSPRVLRLGGSGGAVRKRGDPSTAIALCVGAGFDLTRAAGAARQPC